jgi:hypothetical protein
MATPTWKIVPDASDTAAAKYKAFREATKFFAVDASGSTGGAPLRSEEKFVQGLHDGGQKTGDWFTKWGTDCELPKDDWSKFTFHSRLGGTQPSNIFRNEKALSCIHSSDVWVLLTDGEVWETEVQDLATLGQEKGVFSAPTIFLITSTLTSSPNEANVSVVGIFPN